MHIVHSRSARSSVHMEVALYMLPMKVRGRGACVKSFQTLLSIRKRKMSEDFNVVDGSVSAASQSC